MVPLRLTLMQLALPSARMMNKTTTWRTRRPIAVRRRLRLRNMSVRVRPPLPLGSLRSGAINNNNHGGRCVADFAHLLALSASSSLLPSSAHHSSRLIAPPPPPPPPACLDLRRIFPLGSGAAAFFLSAFQNAAARSPSPPRRTDSAVRPLVTRRQASPARQAGRGRILPV